ncbi:two-component system response regulator [Escherichia coli]|uniref:Two-component system response regulator n=1 Tax=Escherichia coli TaxID=562 RepID=A0A376L3H8_ECOLX|nr:two-component system response regulator [Escherichia coli]
MTHDNIDILVVDDDISHCTILQALLRGWGYNVALANSGRQALEQVREQVFDLVLCDVRMAEMDGIATLKEIKALNPAIPVLIMTAYLQRRDGGRGTDKLGRWIISSSRWISITYRRRWKRRSRIRTVLMLKHLR